MRILFVTHYTELYGANKSLLEIINNIKRIYNIDSTVITPGKGEFNKELDKIGVENYTFKYYKWVVPKDINKLKWIVKFIQYKSINFINLILIIKKLKNINFNIVHTNSSVIDIGAKIAKYMNIKHIWHIREFGEEDYDLKYYKSFNKSCEFINNYSNKVICISNAIKNKYINNIDNNKLRLIFNGINENDYLLDILDKDFKSEFNIIFTGLISKNKNQMELLKAVELLINKHKKYDVKVYYLGDGDQDYINKMKQFCIDQKITANILFEGRVNNVKDYIYKSHVGVICSENEAFGRVTVEYMMGGLAVIASNTGANLEIINVDGGITYKLGDIKELSEKLLYLYENRDILKRYAISGQTIAINNFTSDINCKNIYNLYRQIMLED